MPQPPENQKSRSVFYKMFKVALPLEKETTWFILVSALDIFLTYLVIRNRGFTEGNPIALFFLHSWGIKGLVYFKCVMVAFVAVITQIIALKNVSKARWTINLGTLIVSGVLVYSTSLLLKIWNIL